MSTETHGQAGVVPGWRKGDRFRRARDHAGLDQAELAEALGISRRTVGKYERDEVEARRSVMIAWAFRTGVSLSWLESGDTPPPLTGGGATQWAPWDSNPQPTD